MNFTRTSKTFSELFKCQHVFYKDNRMRFLNENIIRKQGQFTTSAYRKKALVELILIFTTTGKPYYHGKNIRDKL